eukprot:675099-Prorocentrum_minimum.AAC.1
MEPESTERWNLNPQSDSTTMEPEYAAVVTTSVASHPWTPCVYTFTLLHFDTLTSGWSRDVPAADDNHLLGDLVERECLVGGDTVLSAGNVQPVAHTQNM